MIRSATQYLITGASSDIGKALVQNLTRVPGCRVLAISRSEALPGDVAQTADYRHIGGLDLTLEKSLDELSAACNNFFPTGGFTLVHSVGNFWYHKPITMTTLSEAAELMQSHYLSLYGVLKVLIPIFRHHGCGRIIAFSCTSVGHSYPEMAAFTSVKAAIESLIKCTANENARYNIIANAIALSTIFTEKVQHSKAEKYHKGYVTIDELLEVVRQVAEFSPLLNGNIIKLLKYSDVYYNEGYFQRNPTSMALTKENNHPG